MLVDHSGMRLGKLAPKRSIGLPMLARYTAALPPPPASVRYSDKLSNLGLMLNDRLGDCTCAAAGHLEQLWSALAGNQFIPTDGSVLSLYEKSCGYNPGDSSTDQGGVEDDVLSYWHDNPTILGGSGPAAFCSVRPGFHNDVKNSIWLFGAAYIGVDLPVSAQSQAIWDVPAGGAIGPGAPGSWGGHAIIACDYDDAGLAVITWGAIKRMTWAFWDAYCDESHGVAGKDLVGASPAALAPSGFNWDQLMADMAEYSAPSRS